MAQIINSFNGLDVYDAIPNGYKYDTNSGSPLTGYAYIINGSPLSKGFRRAFAPLERQKIIPENFEKSISFEKKESQKMHPGAPKAMNNLARLKAKEQILTDILVDLKICEIEGWDKTEYINELKELINGIGNDPK